MDKQRDWKAFCGLIKAADEMTTGKSRSAAALSLMFDVLARYGLEEVKDAVRACIEKNKFLVTPADIVRHIDGDPHEKSAAAWRLFLRAFERYCYFDSVRFPEPAFHYVIEQYGGWVKLCEEWRYLTSKELEFREKDWRTLFEVGSRVASWDERPGKIKVFPYQVGFFEINNRAGGYDAFIPDVYDVSTGTMIPRETLAAGQARSILRLPVRVGEAVEF